MSATEPTITGTLGTFLSPRGQACLIAFVTATHRSVAYRGNPMHGFHLDPATGEVWAAELIDTGLFDGPERPVVLHVQMSTILPHGSFLTETVPEEHQRIRISGQEIATCGDLAMHDERTYRQLSCTLPVEAFRRLRARLGRENPDAAPTWRAWPDA